MPEAAGQGRADLDGFEKGHRGLGRGRAHGKKKTLGRPESGSPSRFRDPGALGESRRPENPAANDEKKTLGQLESG